VYDIILKRKISLKRKCSLRRTEQDIKIKNQPDYKSIARIAKILSSLSEGMNEVNEIARHCDLNNPTVCRLLKSLENSKFVIRDPIHRKYYLGSLLNKLVANPNTTHLNLIALSKGEMDRLSKISGETVVLNILVGIQKIRLHIIPGKDFVKVYDAEDVYLTNTILPGASTKALLAQLDRKDLDKILLNINSENLNKEPPINRAEYIQQVTKVKEQGYAVSQSQIIPDTLMISAIIPGYHYPAVLSVMGFASHLEPRADEILPEILASANRLSSELLKYSNIMIVTII
jgi:DNA-binding IclR family transcriptional regulator